MIFFKLSIFRPKNVSKPLKNGLKLMILAFQNRSNDVEKVYHFDLVCVETPPRYRPKITKNAIFWPKSPKKSLFGQKPPKTTKTHFSPHQL